MPSRTRNAFNWVLKPARRIDVPREAYINRASGIPLILGDTVLGQCTKAKYRIIIEKDDRPCTERISDGGRKSLGVATEGGLILSAEQAKRRLAAYEKWKAKQQEA